MIARPLLRLLALVLCASSLPAQTGGQAFVLNRFGQHVQGNSFPRKDGAYLSGGPGFSCLAPGLADGDYCFQITDPAGTLLLTPDPIQERSVRVAGGVVAQYLGTTRAASPVGPCGALNVRLAPFLATPYPSREYKVWLTRIADYDPQGSGLFGFNPARSKSDNFRVNVAGPQTILSGYKFYDYQDDGVWNPAGQPLEVPIGGWRVEILRDGVVDGTTFTDQDGRYTFIRNRDGGAWQVREISPNGFINDATSGATWLATTPLVGSVLATGEYAAGPDFGNVRYEVAVGVGRSVDFWGDRNCNCNDTGTACGVSILRACDPQWRSALNVRNGQPVNLRNPVSNDNPSASIFTLNLPPQSFCGAYANWKSYVNKNPHDHAGFLLSRQVAATLLNIRCGLLQGDIYVDRFQDGVLVSLDDMLTGAIGLLSQTGAGLTGPNDPYQDLRHMMQMCTNEFGSINNTGDPSAPQVVYTRSNEPGLFASPY
ncbi:MAG: hypothetical protein NTY35_11630 [Planctomycetota bacterium]|nr:hypothetical protein [Planctomycetota bacterium]